MTIKKALCFWLLILYVCAGYAQELPKLIPFRKGNKWGYANTIPKVIIPASFDAAGLFGIAPAHIKTNIPGNWAWVKKGGKEYWITPDGKLTAVGSVNVKKDPEREQYLTESMREPVRYKNIFTDPKTGKKGVVNEAGDTLLPAMYEELKVESYDLDYYVQVRENRKWGVVIAKPFKWIVPATYDKVEMIKVPGNFASTSGFKVLSNGLYGVVIEDSLILSPEYKSIDLVGKKYGAVLLVKRDKGIGMVNLKGKTLTSELYDQIDPVGLTNTNVTPVLKNGKWGLLNMYGRVIAPIKYESCTAVTERDGLYWVKYQGKKGLVDYYGTKYFED